MKKYTHRGNVTSKVDVDEVSVEEVHRKKLWLKVSCCWNFSWRMVAMIEISIEKKCCAQEICEMVKWWKERQTKVVKNVLK